MKYPVWFKITVLIFLHSLYLQGQELQVDVVVSAPGVTNVNKQIFRTLEKSITEFFNTTRWTERVFKPEERIKAHLVLVVKEYKDNHFVCEMNIASYRPVYNSNYETLLLQFADKNVRFTYLEYQPLTFNPDILDNDLTTLLAFYAYVILGYDFDSFKLNAGNEYFKKAKEIQVTAAGQGMAGWESQGKSFSRARWIDQLLLPSNIMFHKAFYTYHRHGLDQMADDLTKGKTNVIRAIQYLEKVPENSSDLLIKTFFNTKADEIVQILSQGPKTANQKLIYDTLMKLAPMYRMKWEQLN